MAKFDSPHKRIHALADKAFEIREKYGKSEAKELIRKARETDLRLMIDLFDNFKEALIEARREIIVVVNVESKKYALTADSTDSISDMDNKIITPPSENGSRFIKGIYTDESGVILAPNIHEIVN